MASFMQARRRPTAPGTRWPSGLAVSVAVTATAAVTLLNAVGAFGRWAAAGAVALACGIAALGVRASLRAPLAEPLPGLATEASGRVVIRAARAAELAGDAQAQNHAA